jgi:hypothetical protein
MATALAFIIPLDLEFRRALLWISISLTIASGIDYVLVGQKRLDNWE